MSNPKINMPENLVNLYMRHSHFKSEEVNRLEKSVFLYFSDGNEMVCAFLKHTCVFFLVFHC